MIIRQLRMFLGIAFYGRDDEVDDKRMQNWIEQPCFYLFCTFSHASAEFYVAFKIFSPGFPSYGFVSV